MSTLMGDTIGLWSVCISYLVTRRFEGGPLTLLQTFACRRADLDRRTVGRTFYVLRFTREQQSNVLALIRAASNTAYGHESILFDSDPIF